MTKSAGPSQRQLRVGEQVRHALTEVLQRGEVRDEVLETALVSVSEVRMSPDLKIATAFVSPMGAADDQAVIKALARNAKFIRGRVSGALRQMKYMPEFRFRARHQLRQHGPHRRASAFSASGARSRPRRGRRERGLMARQQRRKKGRPVSGWLVFDKPKGMGSTDAVSKIKWLYGAEKAGHAGTLDPLASGMLPIALGEATKTVPYVQDGAKVYRFTVAWGEERTTDDLEGAPTKTSSARPGEAEIRAAMPKYTGVIMQTPPQFSAIKIAGERAYDLAREGETVEIPAREVEIARFDLIAMPDADTAVFEIECGKGTYVRSIARDLGRDLGCYGHIAELRRTEVYPFTPDDLVTLAELEQAATPASPPEEGGERPPRPGPEEWKALDALLLDTGAALDSLPQVVVTDDAASRIRLGNPVIVRGRDAPAEADEACAFARGRLVAIGAIEAGMFRPKRVFTN